MNGQSEKQDIALGVDVRSGEELPYLEIIIRKWRENKYPFSILFLDSSDEVLIKRFKETETQPSALKKRPAWKRESSWSGRSSPS